MKKLGMVFYVNVQLLQSITQPDYVNDITELKCPVNDSTRNFM